MISVVLAGYDERRAPYRREIIKESIPNIVKSLKSLEALIDEIIIYTNPSLKESLYSSLELSLKTQSIETTSKTINHIDSIQNIHFNTQYSDFTHKLLHIFNLARDYKVLIATGDLYNAHYKESTAAIREFIEKSIGYNVTIGSTPYWRLEELAPEILSKKPSKSPLPLIVKQGANKKILVKKMLVKEANLVFLDLKQYDLTWIGQSLNVMHSKRSLLDLYNVIYWIRMFSGLTKNVKPKRIQRKLSYYVAAYLLTSFFFKSFYKTFYKTFKDFGMLLDEQFFIGKSKKLLIPDTAYMSVDAWADLLYKGYGIKASVVILDNIGGALLALDADSEQQLSFYKNELPNRL